MSEEIKSIKLIYNTVAGGAVWFAGDVLRVGFDVDENEARSLLLDGMATLNQTPNPSTTLRSDQDEEEVEE